MSKHALKRCRIHAPTALGADGQRAAAASGEPLDHVGAFLIVQHVQAPAVPSACEWREAAVALANGEAEKHGADELEQRRLARLVGPVNHRQPPREIRPVGREIDVTEMAKAREVQMPELHGAERSVAPLPSSAANNASTQRSSARSTSCSSSASLTGSCPK